MVMATFSDLLGFGEMDESICLVKAFVFTVANGLHTDNEQFRHAGFYGISCVNRPNNKNLTGSNPDIGNWFIA